MRKIADSLIFDYTQVYSLLLRFSAVILHLKNIKKLSIGLTKKWGGYNEKAHCKKEG